MNRSASNRAFGRAARTVHMAGRLRLYYDLFKLRIGLVIGVTALVGVAITPGPGLAWWRTAILGLAVVLASAAAGAFNQYYERHSDANMARTRGRPFVKGTLRASQGWLWLMALMTLIAVIAATLATNAIAALYVFLGAFVYAIVYTVWLKRRSWLNIVVGGLAGSFAVLAGAAAVTPGHLGAVPLLFALVLFLWTPPHFWSLAIAYSDDYRNAGVPMLPTVLGDQRAARVVLLNTIGLVAASLLPAFFGLGWIYFATALGGGTYFVAKSVALAKLPNRATAMANFHASLMQLSLLLLAAVIDRAVFS